MIDYDDLTPDSGGKIVQFHGQSVLVMGEQDRGDREEAWPWRGEEGPGEGWRVIPAMKDHLHLSVLIGSFIQMSK